MRQTGSTPSRRTFVGASLGFALAAQAVPAHGQDRSPQMEATIRAGSVVTTLSSVY